jgi:hypothetical protein
MIDGPDIVRERVPTTEQSASGRADVEMCNQVSLRSGRPSGGRQTQGWLMWHELSLMLANSFR